MTKKILIIGNSANSYALAKKLSGDNEVLVLPGSSMIKEFATCVDIREDSVSEILEFVLENGIDLTIVVSPICLKTSIVDIFNKNHQPIFAPSYEATKIVFDKAFAKKTLYKLRIPTPKFGIFEKQNLVVDYLKNQKTPFVLKTNESSSAVVLTSVNMAKPLLESYFAQRAQKLIIEDYIWGIPFSFYTITDGYKALPIGSSILYTHSLEGDGGQLTSGMGACVPNYKLSVDNEYFLMDNVVYPIIESLEMNGNSYVGILGINGILAEDGTIQVLGFNTFFNDCDCDAVLELIDANLYELFESCVIGSFSDEVDTVPQKDLSATSLVLVCKNKENNENIIQGLENLDEDVKVSYYSQVRKNKYLEFEVNQGAVMVLTSLSRTVSTSTNKVYEEAENIKFKGISYRKDICKPMRTTV